MQIRSSSNVATVTDQASRRVELMKEYRTRLVAAVVTGKLDAREAGAQLPEEAYEQNLIEEGGPVVYGMDATLYSVDASQEEWAIESEVTA